MTDENQEVTRVNPRSTGIIGIDTYVKHTTEQSLEPEAKELGRCQQLGLATEHVQPVKLLNYDKANNRLTTRKVNGAELFHTLWNSSYLLGRLKGNRMPTPNYVMERIEELGSWLRLYHESSRVEKNSADGSWLIAAFDQKVKDARDYHLLPEPTIKKIEARFGPELQRLADPDYFSDSELFQCKLHGDFVIYNIMIDDNQDLHVMDFGDTRESINLEDVARFYSSLWAISETNSYRKRLLKEAIERFLHAYGYGSGILDTEYFKCNLAYNFLTHLSGQHHMKHLLSWTSYREINQITRAGLRWINSEL